MEGMEKFAFKPAVVAERPSLLVHFDKPLHERFIAGCKQLGIPTEKIGERRDTTKQQALIRQMIDHCLKDMGV